LEAEITVKERALDSRSLTRMGIQASKCSFGRKTSFRREKHVVRKLNNSFWNVIRRFGGDLRV